LAELANLKHILNGNSEVIGVQQLSIGELSAQAVYAKTRLTSEAPNQWDLSQRNAFPIL